MLIIRKMLQKLIKTTKNTIFILSSLFFSCILNCRIFGLKMYFPKTFFLLLVDRRRCKTSVFFEHQSESANLLQSRAAAEMCHDDLSFKIGLSCSSDHSLCLGRMQTSGIPTKTLIRDLTVVELVYKVART